MITRVMYCVLKVQNRSDNKIKYWEVQTMEKELKYLGEQTLFHSYSEEIRQIVKNEENQDQLKRGSVFGVALDCFALGIIVGKKLERARRKGKNK